LFFVSVMLLLYLTEAGETTLKSLLCRLVSTLRALQVLACQHVSQDLHKPTS
jgi:hypothetical protein